jgi:glycosyltransferase involved in cell wall biosynthesis
MFNQMYYGVKPMVPLYVRRAVRRWFAWRKRRKAGEVWPIMPGSEQPPPNWPGWPGGKKFAFVLTHDVEGQFGYDQCRKLMQLEMKMGFRSSFNLIPEGEYTVSKELQHEMTANGFEVGVHDLRHDGKLYQGRSEFAANAARINHYLKDWNAVGFRAGFMFHNLEWLQDLEIQYDASTFDTDPFEPQPDGARTIFPFWKAGPNGRGYVELPYTLPQDSTLFLLFGESKPDIWMRKLDWVAEHGGMAMVIVHPDYVSFNGSASEYRSFPVSHYETLLEYLRQKYGSSVWLPLPKELAAWYRKTCVRPAPVEISASPALSTNGRLNGIVKKAHLRPKRAAVVLYSYYATDPRPRRESEALAKAGMEVDVICLRKEPNMPPCEVIDGVQVFNAPLRRRRATKMTYITQYGAFFLHAFAFLSRRNLRKRYDLVHVHNMPDFLVFSAILPRLMGAKIILDLHDPMPELFRGIYNYESDGLVVRLLSIIERMSIGFADLVVTPNTAFKEVFALRSSRPEKIEIVMNSPKATLFHPGQPNETFEKLEENRPFLLMYHGLLVERHGLDLAIRAMAQLQKRIPGLQLHIYGEETFYALKMVELAKELGLGQMVQYHGYKSQKEIAEIISRTDLGLVPNRLNPFTQINFPTRIFEYLTMHKPVLVPRTKGISDYFAENEILYFEPDNVEDLTAKIEWAFRHPSELQALAQAGRVLCGKYSWEIEEKHFIGLVDNLLAN